MSVARPLGKRLASTRPILVTSCFHAHYTPQYIPLGPSSVLLLNRDHPLHFKCLAKITNAPREGLWWFVQNNFLNPVQRCIRVRRGRRVKAAILGALREGGWDAKGLATRRGMLSLTGSLEVLASPGASTASWDDLKKAGQRLIGTISRQSGMGNEAGVQRAPAGKPGKQTQRTGRNVTLRKLDKQNQPIMRKHFSRPWMENK